MGHLFYPRWGTGSLLMPQTSMRKYLGWISAILCLMSATSRAFEREISAQAWPVMSFS